MIPLSDSHPARGFPIVNILLIAITVFVFFQQITASDQDAFIQTYSLIPQLVDFSNFETLIPFVTAMFLHGGLLHIGSNMLFLWVFGDNVEGHIGPFFYGLLYFVSGIVGNLLQYILMPDSPIPMLGASGAVAGVLGAYYIMFPFSRIKTLLPIFFFITIVEIPAGFMLGYWFVLQLLSGAASLGISEQTGGIAFFAHIGGFITGIVAGKMYREEESG